MICKNDHELPKIKRLYVSSFPDDERIPYHRLVSMLGSTRVMHAYYDDGQFIGMTYIFLFRDIAYLGYIAVEEELRGKGFGTSILNMLCDMYPAYRIAIDIEEPDAEADNAQERVKRRNFYTANRFEGTGIFYRFYHMDYEILSRNGIVTKDEWHALITEHWEPFAGSAKYKEVS